MKEKELKKIAEILDHLVTNGYKYGLLVFPAGKKGDVGFISNGKPSLIVPHLMEVSRQIKQESEKDNDICTYNG